MGLNNNMIKSDLLLNIDDFVLSFGGSHDGLDETSSLYTGVRVQDSASSGPLKVGLEARLYALDNNLTYQKNSDFDVAFSLGGWCYYNFPKANRLRIYASSNYVPTILSFSKLDHMYNYDIRGEYMMTKRTCFYIDYGMTVSEYSSSARIETSNGVSIGSSVQF